MSSPSAPSSGPPRTLRGLPSVVLLTAILAALPAASHGLSTHPVTEASPQATSRDPDSARESAIEQESTEADPGQEPQPPAQEEQLQEEPAVSGRPEPPAGLDPDRLEAFVDGLMAAYMEAHHTAGATVAVVDHGRVALLEGYGWADVEARRPVDPRTTLFRIGSISKLFTWIAVMQLVEEGRLDLDVDVNTWLSDFQVPATYEEPITLEHLMTHSAGFEDRVIGLFGRDEDSLAPLGQILAEQLPARIRPPGEVSSYSNHGTALAAHVVEQVTGTSLSEYAEREILGPLGMERTTFEQPPAADLESDLSTGYRYSEQVFEPQGFEFVPLAPAGAVSSTAADMARFMLANLADGALGDARILRADSMRRMRGAVFRHAPQVNPMGYGYLDFSLGGQWVVGHGGDTFWFHSVMALLPEHDLGFFISVNTDEGAQISIPFTEAFVEHFFPVDPPLPGEAAEGFRERAERYTGYYRANRYAHTTLAKLSALGAVEVSATEDALHLSSTGKQRWVEVEPGVFRNALDGDVLVFRQNDAGDVTHMFVGPLQIAAFDRLHGIETPPFQLAIFGYSAVVFTLTLVLWPVAAMVRRRFDVHHPREARLPLGARLTGWLAALLFLGFLGAAMASLSEPTAIVYGVPTLLKAALWLPLVAIFFSVGALLYMVSIWRRQRAGLWTRLWYTLLVIACFASLWQLHYWNLLGFRY